jgi:hypothetical protein
MQRSREIVKSLASKIRCHGSSPKRKIPTLAKLSHRRQHNVAADPDAYKNAKSRAVRYAALAIKKLLPRRKLAEWT